MTFVCKDNDVGSTESDDYNQDQESPEIKNFENLPMIIVMVLAVGRINLGQQTKLKRFWRVLIRLRRRTRERRWRFGAILTSYRTKKRKDGLIGRRPGDHGKNQPDLILNAQG